MNQKYSLEEFDLIKLNQDLYYDEDDLQLDNYWLIASNTRIGLKLANVIKKGTYVLILGFTHRSHIFEYDDKAYATRTRELISPIFYFEGRAFCYFQVGDAHILEIFKKISDGNSML